MDPNEPPQIGQHIAAAADSVRLTSELIRTMLHELRSSWLWQFLTREPSARQASARPQADTEQPTKGRHQNT